MYYSLFDLNGEFTLSNYVNFFSAVVYEDDADELLVCDPDHVASRCSFAYPTAYLLTKTKHKQLWLMLIILPSWINLLLKTYAFIGIFGLYGPVNAFLQVFGFGTEADSVYGLQLHFRIRVYFHPVHDLADLQLPWKSWTRP